LPVDNGHLAEIGAGREIGEEHLPAADRLFDDHRAAPEDENVLVFIAFCDHDLTGSQFHHFRIVDEFGHILS